MIVESTMMSIIILIIFLFLIVIINFNRIKDFIDILLIRVQISDLFLKSIESEDIALQIKDKNHRYLYFNNFLKKSLYPNENNILNRNDYEILTGRKIENGEIEKINETIIEMIKSRTSNTMDEYSICFTTDVYIKKYGEGRFIELVKDMILDVYKEPVKGLLGYKYSVGVYKIKYRGENPELYLKKILENCKCLLKEIIPNRIYKVEDISVPIDIKK